jgi:predicted nuclease of predicted toxin-antitoxin system
MRFLADESCDFAAVRALRGAGHDVVVVAEVAQGAKDVEVIGIARQGPDVLLTEDKDFGQLVYAGGQRGIGVVLIRFPASVRKQLGAAVLDLVRRFGDRLPTSFAVLEPGRVKIRSTAAPEDE